MKQAFEITIKSSDIPYAERRKKMQKWIDIILFNKKNINELNNHDNQTTKTTCKTK